MMMSKFVSGMNKTSCVPCTYMGGRGRLIAGFLFGDGAKDTVGAEPFEDAGAYAEEAAVQRGLPGFDRAPDPRKGHQVRKRKPHCLMLAKVMTLFRGQKHGALPRRLGDAHPLADEIRQFRRRALEQRFDAAAHGMAHDHDGADS